MNYYETVEYIHSLGNFKLKPGLERINKALEQLGNPQSCFEAVHIAGTNGKGSVSAMIAEAFKASGFKTGLFVSPYVINFRERIQINGEFITEDALAEYADRVKSTGAELSEFEFITAMAFLYFADKKCDIAVVETGLGGRLDATNALTRVRAAVITAIGLDHTAILGGTYAEITREKCGILANFPSVLSPNQPPEVVNTVYEYTNPVIPDVKQLEITSSGIYGTDFVYKGLKYSLTMPGIHQVENAITAIEAINLFGCKIPYKAVNRALKAVRFPARAEVICKSPLVVLDGAHNPHGAAALSALMKEYKGRITAIVGVMRDKDYNAVLKKTLPHCKAALAVTVEAMPRALSGEKLAEAANAFCPCSFAESYGAAIEAAFKTACGEPIFVFGSLYLAGGIRELLKYYCEKNF